MRAQLILKYKVLTYGLARVHYHFVHISDKP